jgi:two-component system chemotaxis sensor kinase CheA
MPDPNVPLDPTGGAGGMPDPNVPLDPTGGAGGMPDPNVPLDPTGGAGGMPDPNVPLDPTGGAGGMPDPNVPLDPTGGAGAGGAEAGEEWGSSPLMIPEEEAEALQFCVADVRRALEDFDSVLAEASEFSSRPEAAARLGELAERVGRLTESFELPSFARLVCLLESIASRMGELDDVVAPEVVVRVRGIGVLIDQFCAGLEVGFELKWPLSCLERRVGILLNGVPLHESLMGWHEGDGERLLELDGVTDGVLDPPRPAKEEGDRSSAGGSSSLLKSLDGGGAERTIRVEQGVIEEFLDIMRQLVLNKNYFQGYATRRRGGAEGDDAESLSTRADEYERLVGRLQDRLTRTRVQEIGGLLDRYERVVRDVAQIADKRVSYEVRGGEVRVDKFMTDAIAESIAVVLRHAAGSAIETPSERASKGKPEEGRLIVEVSDQGSHVWLTVRHDGVWPGRDEIESAVRGMEGAPALALSSMGDGEVALLPYESWYAGSEVAGVSDVVRSLGGSLEVHREGGGFGGLRMVMPVTGAVIGVMRVGVGGGVYAVPIGSVVEIIGVEEEKVSTIGEAEVLRFRGTALPLIDTRSAFGVGDGGGDGDGGAGRGGAIAVVLSVGGEMLAMRADRVLGHHEIVIEPLDMGCESGPFLGAAIQEDGSVALVVDAQRMMREAPGRREVGGAVGAGAA